MENTIDDLHVHVPLFDKIVESTRLANMDGTWPGMTTLLTKNGGAVYLILLGALLGVQLWQSYIGAVVTYKTLPKNTFGRLQAKLVPAYTIVASTLASALLGRWIVHRAHALDFGSLCEVVRGLKYAGVYSAIHTIHTDAFNTILLAAVGLAHFVNLAVLAPATTDFMFARHRLEADVASQEKKTDVSPEMHKLNRKFNILHSLSSFVDLSALAATLLHALFVGYIGTNNL
ncbi:hypothetical protein E3P98_01857 [Wallemia ichthyophaga]|nr:hypothetical protein E3P98_01857 [Wallemia ichthyophaga]